MYYEGSTCLLLHTPAPPGRQGEVYEVTSLPCAHLSTKTQVKFATTNYTNLQGAFLLQNTTRFEEHIFHIKELHSWLCLPTPISPEGHSCYQFPASKKMIS